MAKRGNNKVAKHNRPENRNQYSVGDPRGIPEDFRRFVNSAVSLGVEMTRRSSGPAGAATRELTTRDETIRREEDKATGQRRKRR